MTRQSILELSREMGGFKVTERDFTMDELKKAVKENRVGLAKFRSCLSVQNFAKSIAGV